MEKLVDARCESFNGEMQMVAILLKGRLEIMTAYSLADMYIGEEGKEMIFVTRTKYPRAGSHFFLVLPPCRTQQIVHFIENTLIEHIKEEEKPVARSLAQQIRDLIHPKKEEEEVGATVLEEVAVTKITDSWQGNVPDRLSTIA